MGFINKNFRLLVVLVSLGISFFSFFSIYLTESYNHLKKTQIELDKAREAREIALTEQVVGPDGVFDDPLKKFIDKNGLSKGEIKEIDNKIRSGQILYKNSIVTITTQLMLGLDLIGGAQLTFQAIPPEGTQINDETISGLIKVFENRVNASGTTEAVVQQVGKDRILVEIPGADPGIVKRRLLKTAQLEFKEPAQVKAQPLTEEVKKLDLTKPPTENKNSINDPNKQLPTLIEDKKIDQAKTPPAPVERQIWVPTGITGKDLKKAQAVSDGAGNWLIHFSLKGNAIEDFGRLTERLIGKPIAIFLDGKLISSPTVRSAITGGEGQIEGRFTPEEAQDLAVQLNAGALPVPVKIIQERSVGATLGQDSIDKSLIAGLYGVIFVVLFMIGFYRLPGVVASIALLLYTLISLAVFEHTVTLTLAGVAGFILSIGMAVDANILIFERTKEELKGGKSFFQAIDAGFDRAFTSIFDSNINTLIACFVLLIFGTGLVKGFAVTLALGVLVSMFSAIFVTRTLLLLTTKVEGFRNPVLFGVKL